MISVQTASIHDESIQETDDQEMEMWGKQTMGSVWVTSRPMWLCQVGVDREETDGKQKAMSLWKRISNMG